MNVSARIEKAIESAFIRVEGQGGPPRLTAAMRYAVFPGGARIRPRLTLAVAAACGADDPGSVDAAAVSIELMHCASLAHDDLPCFDDAALRRGKPSLHKAFDQRLAVLSGDALIVLAFQTLVQGDVGSHRLGALVSVLTQAVGAPTGIVAGQAWECEPLADVATYHRQKTGALFAGAAMMGAAACGAEAEPWRRLGEALGQAYQAADDIGDVGSEEAACGKTVGRDHAFGRPSIVAEYGLSGALKRFNALLEQTLALIPSCPGASDLEALISIEARRLLPTNMLRRAA